MARPHKRTKTALSAVCEALRAGATYDQAARSAGISYSTLSRWRESDDQADAEVMQAEQVAARRWLACIDRAADSEWRAAAWLLERRFPEVYRREATAVDAEARRTVYRVRFEGEPFIDYDDVDDD